MSGGPIVRSGASPEFSKGWDSIFGQGAKAAKSSASKSTTAAAKKAPAKKAAAKKAVKKTAKK